MRIVKLIARLFGKPKPPEPPRPTGLLKLTRRSWQGNASRRFQSRPVRGNAA
jgi:hypothetical protein